VTYDTSYVRRHLVEIGKSLKAELWRTGEISAVDKAYLLPGMVLL